VGERSRVSAAAGHLGELLGAWGAGTAEDLARLFEPELAALPPGELPRLLERLQTTGSRWGYFPAEPFVRSLSRQVIARVLEPGSGLEEGSGLDAARGGPLLLVGNHLSYVDVNVLDALLAQTGHAALADRITALAGPKVYAAPVRRLASLCFGTIKIPQSSAIASEQEILPAREIARISGEALGLVRERSAAGDHVLVFPEGSRSRTGALRPLLAAASRYLECGALRVVPFGHWGTERLVPLGEDHVYPTRVHARIGASFDYAELAERCGRRRSLISDCVGFLIADLLPPAYRGVYGAAEPGRELARKIASDLSAG
jgi:1-acyl-sn-glycerol-3-phosphate acyltransferase